MIQRIQTIYLLITALLIGSSFLAGMNYMQVEGFTPSDRAEAAALQDGLYSVWDSGLLQIASALAGILALLCIFLYKNRPLQMKLTRLVLILVLAIAVYIGVSFFLAWQAVRSESTHTAPGLALLPLLAALVSSALAARAINKDEKLVRSADRLR